MTLCIKHWLSKISENQAWLCEILLKAKALKVLWGTLPSPSKCPESKIKIQKSNIKSKVRKATMNGLESQILPILHLKPSSETKMNLKDSSKISFASNPPYCFPNKKEKKQKKKINRWSDTIKRVYCQNCLRNKLVQKSIWMDRWIL